MAEPARDIRERERLAALERYDILDTPPEEAFDRITRLVRRLFGVPVATVTFLDAHRLWFKSEIGFGQTEIERSTALCDIAIRHDGPLIVKDSLTDPRFAGRGILADEPPIRFYAGMPLLTPDGHAIGTVCAADTRPRDFTPDDIAALDDIARLTMDALELRRLATQDGLTGALTRRGFRDEAGKAVSLALRHQHPLTCIVFDLDHLKAVNATRGKAAGDRALVAVVAACREKLRITDIIGRVGGGQFAIVLPHTPLKPALDVTEKLRATIAALPLGESRDTFGVTASFGVSSLDRTMGGIEALLARTDGVLAAAKAAGRNRVIAWEQPEPEKATVRRRVLKAGRISFNGRRSSIDCTVRTLSDKEAGLEVFTSAGLPTQFELMIDADRFVRGCHVIGQSEKHLDVAFD